MSSILGRDPKSMKERFCFDPSKIPSGFVKPNSIIEFEKYNDASRSKLLPNYQRVSSSGDVLIKESVLSLIKGVLYSECHI